MFTPRSPNAAVIRASTPGPVTTGVIASIVLQAVAPAARDRARCAPASPRLVRTRNRVRPPRKSSTAFAYVSSPYSSPQIVGPSAIVPGPASRQAAALDDAGAVASPVLVTKPGALSQPVRVRGHLRQLAVAGTHERVERHVERHLVHGDDVRARQQRVQRRHHVALDGGLDGDHADVGAAGRHDVVHVLDGVQRFGGDVVGRASGRRVQPCPLQRRLVGERALRAQVRDAGAVLGTAARHRHAHRGVRASGPGTNASPGSTASVRCATPRSVSAATRSVSASDVGQENDAKNTWGPPDDGWLRRWSRSSPASAMTARVGCREPRWSSAGPNASHTCAGS